MKKVKKSTVRKISKTLNAIVVLMMFLQPVGTPGIIGAIALADETAAQNAGTQPDQDTKADDSASQEKSADTSEKTDSDSQTTPDSSSNADSSKSDSTADTKADSTADTKADSTAGTAGAETSGDSASAATDAAAGGDNSKTDSGSAAPSSSEGTISPDAAATDKDTTEKDGKVCLEDGAKIIDSEKSDWDIDGDTAETKKDVELGVKYIFPGNDKVSVTFTCLPSNSDDRTKLKIEQIASADINLPEGVQAATEYAYDITTGMKDGDFEYDLTLPKAEIADAEVNYIEKSANEAKNENLDASDLKTVDEDKVKEKDDEVKVEELDHFTIWIVSVKMYLSGVLNGQTQVTVSPGETIQVELEVGTIGSGSSNDWKSSRYRIEGGDWICVNTPDHTYSNSSMKESFDITAPSQVGTYNIDFRAYNSSDCSGTSSTYGAFTLIDAIIVNSSQPDLTATKTHTPSGDAVVNQEFTWTIRVENFGDADATFANGVTILTDNLPISGATYGSVDVTKSDGVTGTISCIAFPGALNCAASGGNVVIPPTKYFDVSIPTTPTTAGSLSNPSFGGTCKVDSLGQVGESNETNNNCSDTVTVAATPPVNPDPNPTLGESCGIDVALVVDTSTSIDNGELATMKTALNGFVSAFSGTPTRMAVVSFDDSAIVQSNFTSDLSSLNSVINGINGDGYTNWEDALHDTHGLFPDRASKPDLIVFTTDGDPTASSAGPNDLSQPNAHLAPAIVEANAAKSDGIRIITLGIGMSGSDSQTRLQQISSADAVYNASDFNDLAQTLQELSTDLCGGTITVNKYIGSVDPANRAGEGWTFNVAGESKSTDTNGQTQPKEVSAGTYDVEETGLVSGYSFSSASCSGATYNGTQSGSSVTGIEVGDQDIVSCDFVNTEDTGSIQVGKEIDSNGDGAYDDLSNTPGFKWGYDSEAIDRDMETSAQNVSYGAHTVSESAISGYHFTGWYSKKNKDTYSCANSEGTDYPVPVTVSADADASAIILCNARDTGNLKAVKVVDDETDLSQWSFSLDGGSAVQANGSGEVDFGQVATLDDHTIVESGPDGYHAASISCSPEKYDSDLGAGSATTTVTSGGTTVCTFNNDVDKGSITIIKDANPDDEQDFTFGTTGRDLYVFTLDDNGDNSDGTSNTKTFSSLYPGDYSVTEDAVSGWGLSGLSCTESGGESIENSSTDKSVRKAELALEAGESIVCTFTNTKLGAITITKDVVPDDSSTWDFVVSGQGGPYNVDDLGDGQSQTISDLTPGSYNIVETTDPKYSVSIVCGGVQGYPGANGFLGTVTAGQTLECTFTNTLKTGNIVGTKYNDLNGSGTRDTVGETSNTEPGLEGWTIDLYDFQDNKINTTVTDSKGDYWFNGLAVGDYKVCEVNQDGWTNTDPADASLCKNVSVIEGADTRADFGNEKGCEEGGTWADEVVSSHQGKLKNGNPVTDPERTKPGYVLGEPDGKFFSLGYGGSITVKFEYPIVDEDGSDLSFHEVTNGRSGYPVEKAKVEVSPDGNTWKEVGEVTNKDGGNGIGYLDFSSTGWDWVQYVRVTDTTDDPSHIGTADGYDLDAIDATKGICEQRELYCGDGIKTGEEECDGTDGVTEGESFCTNSCKLIPLYDGQHQCPANTAEKHISSITLDSRSSALQTLSLLGGNSYLLRASGTYQYASDSQRKADPAYGTTDNFNTSRPDIGIWGTNRGVTSILGNFGHGMGVIEWDDDQNINSDHVYSKLIEPGSDVNAQFVISDWYGDWYGNTCDGQSCMNDNNGSLNVDLYECQPNATVKVCKKDAAGTPLAGWKVALKGDKVETVNVLPNGNDYPSSDLESGDYVLEANGTYKYRPGTPGAEFSDAQYSKRNCPGDGAALCSGPYSPWTDVNNFSSPYQGYLGVRINSGLTDWGYYTGDEHKYFMGFEDYSGQFQFNILDDVYGDNSGSIPVDIYKGYAGVTGEDGCAEFEDVPLGDYQVDEALKYGWEYVSGRDEVTVDEPSEEFTLVNEEIPEPVIVDAKKVICDNEADLPNWGGGGHAIGSDTAQDYVNTHQGCHLESQWQFQWAPAGGGSFGDFQKETDALGSPWNTFTTVSPVEINDVSELGGRIEVREVIPTNSGQWVGFSNDGGDNVSAEFYCTGDAANYDNWEWINNPQEGQTYHCVAFNARDEGSITAHKFNDESGDGTQDAGEENLSGWEMNVYGPEDDQCGGTPLYGPVQTDGNGDALFVDIPSGDYYVGETAQDGWKNTTPVCQKATVSGDQNTTVNFANQELAEIWWYKIDANLAPEDSVAGHIVASDAWESQIDGGAGPMNTDVSTASAFSNPGTYNRSLVEPGVHKFEETGQPGWALAWGRCQDSTDAVPSGWGTNIDTDQSQEGIQQVFGPKAPSYTSDYGTLGTSPNSYAEIDFAPGQRVYCVLYNEDKGKVNVTKYNDLNRNGVKDDGEEVLPDWDINLSEVPKGPKTTVKTDENGQSVFDNLAVGEYDLSEDIQTGWVQTNISCSGEDVPERTIDAYNSHAVTVQAGQETNCYIGNKYVIPTCMLQKFNNKFPNNQLPGSDVIYTLLFKVLENNTHGVHVIDLPPAGFKYRPGSWKVFLNGTQQFGVPEPQYHSPGDWDLSSLGIISPDDEVKLEYTADISEDQDSGLYKDLAWAQGLSETNAEVLANSSEEDPFVGTEVNVVQPTGTVAGASVEIEKDTKTKHEKKKIKRVTEILPATGTSPWWIALAILVLLAGAGFIYAGKRKKGKDSSEGKDNSMDTMAKLLVAGLIGISVLFGAKPSQAATANISARMEEPETPTNTSNFLLGFVALDRLGRDMTIECFVDGSATPFETLNLIAGGTSGDCTVDGSVIPSDGTYNFHIVATADSDSVTTPSVSVEVITNGPGTPTNYKRTKVSNCENNVKATTANDGKTAKVEIYRSTQRNFTADSGTLVKSIDIGPNEQVNYTDTEPNCGDTYYYAMRAFDSLGNGSGTVADERVVVRTTGGGTTTITTTVTAPGAIPVAGGGGAVAGTETGEGATTGGEVAGEQTPGEEQAAPGGEQGQVLGEEQAKAEESQSFFQRHPYSTGLAILIILAIIYYAATKKKKTNFPQNPPENPVG